jgi:hypothetical protein
MRACAEAAIIVCEARLRQRVRGSIAGASVEPPDNYEYAEV